MAEFSWWANRLRPPRELTDPAIAGLVGLLGAALRMTLMLRSRGGPAGNLGYDAGVYYNAADALIHGRAPYADFVLLHPPGLMLTLTPFAAVGQLIGDHAAFMVGNTVFTAMGGVNAALVFGVSRRLGVGRRAASVGALFYAVWFGAVVAEVSARLEPLGNLAFLIGLYLLAGRLDRREQRSGGWRTDVFAGAWLAFAASIKIWWIVPVLLVVLWQTRSRPIRALRPLGIGLLGAFAVIDGPFFLNAPTQMWRMVVSDQLGRGGSSRSPYTRLDALSSVHALRSAVSPTVQVVLVVLAGTLVAWSATRARRAPHGRFVLALAGVQLTVLLVAPTYFPYYSGFAAVGVALLVSAGADGGRRRAERTAGGAMLPATATVALASALTVALLTTRATSVSVPFPQHLADAPTDVRCLMADSPMALIELDALSRDLANGCPNWVDVSGRTYDVDAPRGAVTRPHNARWQRDIRRYLLSGNAFLVIRGGTGLSSATKALLARQPELARSGAVIIRAVARARPAGSS